MTRVRIEVDLKPLERYVKILSTPGTNKGYDEILIKWIVRYKKYALMMFNRNSSGGGAWPPLKEPIRKRVHPRSRKILRDSDTLRATLEPIASLARFPKPGISTYKTSHGVSIGFGGGGRHPYSKMSIASLALVHHLGLGRVPEREILIPVTEELKSRMLKDAVEIANKLKRDLRIK